MIMRSVLISIEELNVLRGTLEAALGIIQSYGVTGNLSIPSATPKETKKQRNEKYKRMIDLGLRGKKPNHLKKCNGKNK